MNNYSILIAEDEVVTLSLIASSLEKDYKIYKAKDGEQAYELYNRFKPQIIVCDINMPKINGIDLINKIRKKDLNTKVIITSFKNDIETLLKASELKLTKYLIKPININELKDVIKISISELNNYNTISLENIYITKELVWKRYSYELYNKDKLIKLSPKEKKTLDLLLKKPNMILTYEEIISNVWEDDILGDKNSLKTIITGIRKKAKEIDIQNNYGFGYKINTI